MNLTIDTIETNIHRIHHNPFESRIDGIFITTVCPLKPIQKTYPHKQRCCNFQSQTVTVCIPAAKNLPLVSQTTIQCFWRCSHFHALQSKSPVTHFTIPFVVMNIEIENVRSQRPLHESINTGFRHPRQPPRASRTTEYSSRPYRPVLIEAL